MKGSTLKDVFFSYMRERQEEKNHNRRFQNLLTDYLQIFKEISDLYESNEYYRVYLSPDNKYCRVAIITDSKHKGIDFITKQLNELPSDILFTKNCIIIQRELNFENWNPIKSIFDLSEIKFAIQQSEL